jgi:hypothetical protein
MVRKPDSNSPVIDQSKKNENQQNRTEKTTATYKFTREIKFFADQLNVLPISFPFASLVSTGFVSSVPIPHKNSRKIKVLVN